MNIHPSQRSSIQSCTDCNTYERTFYYDLWYTGGVHGVAAVLSHGSWRYRVVHGSWSL